MFLYIVGFSSSFSWKTWPMYSLHPWNIFSFSIRSVSSLSLYILWKSKFFYSCLFYHFMHSLLGLYTIRVGPFILGRLHLILINQFNILYSLSFHGFNCCLFFICHSFFFFFFCFSFLQMISFPDVVLRQSFPLFVNDLSSYICILTRTFILRLQNWFVLESVFVVMI